MLALVVVTQGYVSILYVFFFQAEDGIRDLVRSRGLGDVYKRQELRDVTSSAAELRPEIIIKPDFQRAADQGVSVLTIARIARIATQGDIDAVSYTHLTLPTSDLV